MYTKLLMLIFLAVHMLCFSGTLHADEIRMKNGDRISGEVIKLKDESVTLKTTYAGTITISWGEVETIQTETPVTLKLKDDTVVNARIEPGTDGKLTLDMPDLDGRLNVALAQVALINPDPPPPALAISGHVNVGISVTEGNTQTKNYSTDGEFTARTEKNRFTAAWIHLLNYLNGARIADNSLGHLNYDYFFRKKWYFLTNVTATQDEFKDIKLRTDLGLGIGHQFWESDPRNLSFEAGLSYTNEDFETAPDEDYGTARWAVKFDHLIGKNNLKFFHKQFGLVSLEDTDDIIIHTLTGLRMPLYKRLTSTIQVKWTWENDPPEGTERNDTHYLFNLGFQY